MRSMYSLESLVTTLVVGGVVGWLASVFMKTRRQMGILADILVGIVGSSLGSWLFANLGFLTWNLAGSLIAGVVGAMALIAILKALKVYR